MLKKFHLCHWRIEELEKQTNQENLVHMFLWQLLQETNKTLGISKVKHIKQWLNFKQNFLKEIFNIFLIYF